MIKEIIETYHRVKEQERKKKLYAQFVKQPLNYDIIQDLVNTAVHSMAIDITLSDGTKLEIRRQDHFDKRAGMPGEYF